MKKERSEVKKIYDTLYAHKFSGRNYGRHNWGEGTYDLIKELKVQSLIDVGCGRNDFVEWARRQSSWVKPGRQQPASSKRGMRAIGVDISSPKADVICPAHNLPFKDKEFEYLTAFDVMEHLLPQEVDDVLDEFNRVASKGFLFHISYRKSRVEVFGKQLHLTVEPESWWIEKIEKFGTINIFHGLTSQTDRKGNIRRYKNVKYIHCVLGKQ
jgi:ubiquinone/menaquinone biosynthesis C-methylase UbiE